MISYIRNIKTVIVIISAAIILTLLVLAARNVRTNMAPKGGIAGQEIESVTVDSLKASSEVQGGLDTDTPKSDQSSSQNTTKPSMP